MELLIPELARVWRERADFPAVGFGPARPIEELPGELPTDVRRLLALSDGIHFGVRASVHSSAGIPAYEGAEMLGVATGVDNPGDYLNIGFVDEEPLLVDTRDGSVWVARSEPGGLWYQGSELLRIADGLDSFLSEWVAGPRFPELVLSKALDEEDRDLSWDDWWRLLQAAGRVPA
ncbi:hypothetical protein [Kitasatospora cineracea]|uniref:SUKH-4 immunity protein of toxin-antitoxin system n=2 Tax=Kitasatospora cineracea TaxID=88074 RepID=A0A3N4S6H4_9ACTN|nr:hypothetical protein [Kitasatospora cineracea]ROR43981.1 hypothetical protein EDD39_2154 [Kitasatospora cineracea]RPE34330.1 hypothetical protein EDD38_2645 [Kitasatospora cineracea]